MESQDSNMPTRGQLERSLSQRVQKLYREQLGHSTGKVTCQWSKDKVTIVIESSLTQPEQLLLKGSDSPDKVEQIRRDLDNVVRPQLSEIIEDILNVQVIDLMSDTTLETGRTGFIAILAEKTQPSSSKDRTAHAS